MLWEKIARGLSAGRVQSVAVKLVVEREREIRAFIPEEYWQVFADTKSQKDDIRLEAVKQAGKTLKLRNKAETDALLNLIKDADYKVSAREDKPTKVNPSAPVYHLDSTTGRQYPSGFLCEENHDAGAASCMKPV